MGTAPTKIQEAPCPTCRKMTAWHDNPHRPFCSDRCRTRDLAAWATESYRLPAESVPEPDAENPAEGEDV